MSTRSVFRTLAIATGLIGSSRAAAAQMLETESERLLPRGTFTASSNFEFQTSADGKETAIPFAFEYGVTSRLELMVEPVLFTGIHPTSGRGATGIGDLEITANYLLASEGRTRPALGLAGEVKIATARNPLIGSREADYTMYLVGSKRLNRFDVSMNVGYTLIGRTEGVPVNNTFSFAASAEYSVGSRSLVFGEVLASSAATSSPESASGTNTSPEAPGGEVVGTLGVAHNLAPSFRLSVGVSYDNQGAFQFRPGFTWTIR